LLLLLLQTRCRPFTQGVSGCDVIVVSFPATRPGRKWAGSKLRVLLFLVATRPGRKWAGGSRLHWLFCGGDARAPVYSEEQSRDTCEDPRFCWGVSQQTKRNKGNRTTSAFRGFVLIPRPARGTISSTSLPQQSLSGRSVRSNTYKHT
jgi:hypothetical protein